MKRPEVCRLLASLVALPSVSGDEAEVASFAADALAAGGLDVERVGDSVVARLERGPGPSLLLNTHLDTVPVGEGWTRDPYAAEWIADGDGERLYGRGANDAKASVAAMIDALLALAREPHTSIEGRVWLALTACEETTNRGMGDALARLGLPDGAVTGEPTGLEVVRAQAGLAVLEATWSGRSCHAAHVARVEHSSALASAVSDLGRFGSWTKLEGEHPLVGPSTVALTVLHSGERHNVVPDRAEALFDARLGPNHRADEVRSLLAQRLPAASVRVRSARLGPVETAADHPLVCAALAAAGRASAVGSSTLSDMALLPGVPAVKCGPGRTERSHVPDEYVLASEVEAGARFYRAFVPAALEALRQREELRPLDSLRSETGVTR